MGYFTAFPDKDTTIYDVEIRGVSKTGSAAGQSEISDLFVLTSSFSNRGKSRMLIQFDISTISASLNSNEIISGSTEFRLKIKNAPHNEENPFSFTLEVRPLSRAWDEGVGFSNYDEELKDSALGNWINPTLLTTWSAPGGDFAALSASQTFDTGFEDVDIDITQIFNAWFTGAIPNNGLALKFIDAHETGSTDLYVKKFFTRHSTTPERVPKLEVFWDDNIFDDRANVHYERSSSIYYYRFVNGLPQSLPGDLFVDILNSSSTVVQTITASLKETGIYEASGAFVSVTSSTQIYRDIWFSGTTQHFTGTFRPTHATGSSAFEFTNLDVVLPNLRDEYNKDQKVTVRVFSKERDYRPAIRTSSSLEPTPLILADAYYSIENKESDEKMVSFSTGSSNFSKLSYDKNGNYFKFWTSSLFPENLYRIKILAFYNNQKFVFDKDWTFKIVDE